MSQVNHVDAVFGGERVRFRIAPADLPGFEALVRGSAYQTFTRFAGGFWTLNDLEAVIAFAWPSLDDAPPRGPRIPIDAFLSVQRTLRRSPPAIYAVLATKILEAALFGVDPAVAVFDEEAAELVA